MRKIVHYLATALLVVPLCIPAFAEENTPQAVSAAPQAQAMSKMMGSDMMGGEMDEQSLKKKQEFFLKMVELSDKIRNTKDEKERDQLKAEQLQLMKHQMQEMMQHCEMSHGKPPATAPQTPASPTVEH